MAMSSTTATTPPREDMQSLIRPDRVHGKIYIDPTIFEREIDQIFGKTWVFVAHESEILNPGDYKTAYIGRNPVIVTRDRDNEIHVLFNRCRHRGSLVCREPAGNAKFFRCPFHGWTYKNSGDLMGVPNAGGYDDDFDKSELGLSKVPRVDNYKGLIFASLNPDVVDLIEYLSGMREYLDRVFLHPAFEKNLRLSAGKQQHEYPANWKHSIEGAVDGYHAAILHESWFAIRNASPERHHARLASRDENAGYSEAHDYGHVLIARAAGDKDVAAFRESHPEYAAKLEREHGPQVLIDLLSQFNVMIFPNLHLTLGNLRVITPLAVDRTQVVMNPMMLADAPDELNAERLREFEEAFASGGFIAPDDAEAFVCVQEGVHAEGADPWMIMTRGFKTEETMANGARRGLPTDETPQRGLYREYLRLMSEGDAQ